MYGISLLRRWLKRNPVIHHPARNKALLRAVESVLSGAHLSLTQMGRRLPGKAFAKHRIKAVDRLVGNKHLHNERMEAYRALSEALLKTIPRPVISVDWADTAQDRKWHILRAAIRLGRRGITVYEEVHPQKAYNNPKTHRGFLNRLRDVLPEHSKPIIVTDAGFRGPWFKHVEALGWDWLGRVRNMVKYHDDETGRWHFIEVLYKRATTKVQHLGEVLLAKRRSYRVRLYLVRAYKTKLSSGRTHPSKSTSLYRELHKAPWLLATSLPHRRGQGKRIKRLYEGRMAIEGLFRDDKNVRWGFGLRHARSRHAKRLEVLLLVAALAALLQWLVGLVAEAHGWCRHFMANTENRRTLSTRFLGQQVLTSERFKPDRSQLASAFPLMTASAETHAKYD